MTGASRRVLARHVVGAVLPFALPIGLSAFLLFSVQPLIRRLVLPVFGGAPAVWPRCCSSSRRRCSSATCTGTSLTRLGSSSERRWRVTSKPSAIADTSPEELVAGHGECDHLANLHQSASFRVWPRRDDGSTARRPGRAGGLRFARWQFGRRNPPVITSRLMLSSAVALAIIASRRRWINSTFGSKGGWPSFWSMSRMSALRRSNARLPSG